MLLETTAGSQLRTAIGGGSYLSQCDRRLFWGIPAGAQATQLQVEWPGGEIQVFPIEQTGRYISVIEP